MAPDSILAAVFAVLIVGGIGFAIILATRQTYSEVIPVPPDRRADRLGPEICQLLSSLQFQVVTPHPTQIVATKASPTGMAEYVLTVHLGGEHIRLDARPRPRTIFLAMLPLTGCGLLCGLTCGATCATTCSCGAGLITVGQAGVGIRAYTNHVFQLIGRVIAEKARGGRGCPKCGTAAPTDARYCRHCGASLSGT